jgi:hypothetical protein
LPAGVISGISTSVGTLNYEHQAPTRELADNFVDARLAAPMAADANDFIWQWSSSADYDAAAGGVGRRPSLRRLRGAFGVAAPAWRNRIRSARISCR